MTLSDDIRRNRAVSGMNARASELVASARKLTAEFPAGKGELSIAQHLLIAVWEQSHPDDRLALKNYQASLMAHCGWTTDTGHKLTTQEVDA